MHIGYHLYFNQRTKFVTWHCQLSESNQIGVATVFNQPATLTSPPSNLGTGQCFKEMRIDAK